MNYIINKFDDRIIGKVWEKGRIVPNYDPNIYRKDIYGAWIERGKHGETTIYGWEIDHILPSSLDGSDEISNLQPLQWQNNRTKGDDRVV